MVKNSKGAFATRPRHAMIEGRSQIQAYECGAVDSAADDAPRRSSFCRQDKKNDESDGAQDETDCVRTGVQPFSPRQTIAKPFHNFLLSTDYAGILLEIFMQRDCAADGNLIRGYSSLEKVGQFLHVLQFHERKRIPRPVAIRFRRACNVYPNSIAPMWRHGTTVGDTDRVAT